MPATSISVVEVLDPGFVEQRRICSCLPGVLLQCPSCCHEHRCKIVPDYEWMPVESRNCGMQLRELSERCCAGVAAPTAS